MRLAGGTGPAPGALRPGPLAGALRARAAAAGRALEPALQGWRARGLVARWTPLWIVNGYSVTGTPEVIRALAARPDVAAVSPDALDLSPQGAPAEPNVAAVGAPALWAAGFTGQGVTVAILDTGVDVSHPDLAARWRGGPGGWLDPYGQHASAHDASGHGTWTAGVLVGGEAGGTALGVAPGARFIAAKVFPDAGPATATAVHAAFQWVLDPDGDPATEDAPRVVNGSWSFGAPGCNLEFLEDLRALRAAGILPVFAAGNYGPGDATSTSPGNYPEALAVGALDGGGRPLDLSSRGPSACGGGPFPALAAPGLDVWTTDLMAWYLPASGTSIAAPHVSGVAALLASAVPGASADQLAAALQAGALDLGAPGPDPATGRGQVDAAGALQALLAPPAPQPPVASADAYTLDAGTSATFTAPGVLANDASPSGAPLSAELAAPPAHGQLALRADGGFDYTPDAGFSGADGFGYRPRAAGLAGAVAAVALTVRPPNQAPVARADAARTAPSTPVAVPVLDNDADPDGALAPATLAGVARPQHGRVSYAGGRATYTPSFGFRGRDTFTYRVQDDRGAWSNAARVTVDIKR
ncbi:MAG: S8 family serine peptidase [Anaeromyxobacter sp.]